MQRLYVGLETGPHVEVCRVANHFYRSAEVYILSRIYLDHPRSCMKCIVWPCFPFNILPRPVGAPDQTHHLHRHRLLGGSGKLMEGQTLGISTQESAESTRKLQYVFQFPPTCSNPHLASWWSCLAASDKGVVESQMSKRKSWHFWEASIHEKIVHILSQIILV